MWFSRTGRTKVLNRRILVPLLIPLAAHTALRAFCSLFLMSLLPPPLFLLALDWIMKRTTADKRRGIRWNFTTVLKDLEFADDIALLSSRLNDLHEKTGRLTEEAGRVGLKLNVKV